MELDIVFRLANTAILSGFTLIRIPYIFQSIKQAASPQDKRTSILYALISALMVFIGFYYLYNPNIFSAFADQLPISLRIIGVVIGVLGNLLLLWTHQSLGKNFAMYVTSIKNHQLVTTGAYAKIRHPMYTGFILILFGFFLTSSNLLIGGFAAAMIYPIIYRMNIEEQYLLITFGEKYADYISATKRLIPFIY